MKAKIYFGTGILLLFMGAVTPYHVPFYVTGTCLLALSFFCLYGVSYGVEYAESHYRIYTRVLFWKTGSWKSIHGVRRICIREYSHANRHPLSQRDLEDEEVLEEHVEYEVYFVRKSGKYKIFSSNSLQAAQEKADRLATRYNLSVGEKALK